MGLFKLIGSVAVGIGTIVTLPVSAPVAGVAGLAAAAATSAALKDDKSDAARKEGYTSGYKRGYCDAMAKVERVLAESSQYEQICFILGAVALGVISAKADGSVSEGELRELQALVGNISKQGYTDDVINKVNWIYNNCNDFEDIIIYLDKIDDDKLEVLNDLVWEIINADDYIDPAEKQIYSQWVDYANYRLS